MPLALSKQRVKFYANEVITVQSQQDQTTGLLFDALTGQLIFYVRFDSEGRITPVKKEELHSGIEHQYQNIYSILQSFDDLLAQFYDLTNGKKPYTSDRGLAKPRVDFLKHGFEQEEFFASITRRIQEERVRREFELRSNTLRSIVPGDHMPYPTDFKPRWETSQDLTVVRNLTAIMKELKAYPRCQAWYIHAMECDLVSLSQKVESSIPGSLQSVPSSERDGLSSPVSQQQTESGISDISGIRGLGHASQSPLAFRPSAFTVISQKESSVKKTVLNLRSSTTNSISTEVPVVKPGDDTTFGKQIAIGSPLARALGAKG